MTDERIDEEMQQRMADAHEKLWKNRRGMVRGTLQAADKLRGVREKFYDKDNPGSKADAGKSAVLFTAFAVAAGAATLRFGGRAALMSVLGLDIVADSGIKEQLDGFLAYCDGLGDLKVLYFLLAWVVAKTFFLDFASVVLALGSGVLFGGVVQGATLSAACATIASLVGFSLARTALREKVGEQLEKRPALRAVEKAVAAEGWKAVLTLRLAPILPVPVGAYSYIYGVTSLPVWEFMLGTFLGSLKPYFFDAYLGIFGKSIIDNDGGSNDLVLLATFAAVVLVGTLASQLAGRTWDQMQEEVRGMRVKEAGADGLDDSWDWLALWGLDKDNIPGVNAEGLRKWQELSSEAKRRCWGVVEQEQARLRAELVGGAPPPDQVPSDPPMAEGGGYDWGMVMSESWEFTFVLIRALSTYSDPSKEELVLFRPSTTEGAESAAAASAQDAASDR